jgi:murein L,D-transpeptidase YcbB/YkuD
MHRRRVVLSASSFALALAVSVTAAVATEPQAAADTSAAAPDVTRSIPPNATAPTSTSATAPAVANPSPADAAAPPVAETDPVIASIRAKLADGTGRRGAAAADFAALQSFYAERDAGPVWMTPMGFSAKAEAAIDEIGNADDWGLSASDFALPPSGNLPDSIDQQANAEIKLQLAILQYARFARGGRANPSSLSNLIDQSPPLLDPKVVVAEAAAAPAPDAYLRSLHPKHQQFHLLRQALLKARNSDAKTRNDRDIQRILINMERWRWMPADLGHIYVQDNIPEFMLYIVKNGKRIHADKIVVGQLRYATPIFSADMKTIVFNPEWTVPPTIVRENLLPNLRSGGWFGGSTSILREHGLRVRYNGRIVDPSSINWSSVNMANIAFTQAPGPTNVLGKLKFVYPNSHMVYMHDTIKTGVFTPAMRAEGHNCIRMEDPPKLAEILLREDKGWDEAKVKALLATADDSAVALDHPVPVHTTYFTAVADADGKVTSFADIYGLDKKVATALLGKSLPPSSGEAERAAAPAEPQAPTPQAKPKAPSESVAGNIQGLFGD